MKTLLPLVALVSLSAGCSLGDGEGDIRSADLTVAGCWNGPFQLTPDFFAGLPFRRTLTMRIQHGGDTEEVSDGAIVLVDDIDKVRQGIASGNATFRVAQPPAIVPPGFPVVADPDPAIVHLTLYLHRSCHAQNSALYSVGGNITFAAIYNGNPNETNAAEKLTDASFTDIEVGDPRDRVAGGDTILNTSHISGNFKFYFQRGQPAQPFP